MQSKDCLYSLTTIQLFTKNIFQTKNKLLKKFVSRKINYYREFASKRYKTLRGLSVKSYITIRAGQGAVRAGRATVAQILSVSRFEAWAYINTLEKHFVAIRAKYEPLVQIVLDYVEKFPKVCLFCQLTNTGKCCIIIT